MAQVTVHVSDDLEPAWMCPDCKREPGPLEPQDEFVWRRKSMTKEDALIMMIGEHRRTHPEAVLLAREREYLEVS